MQRVENVANKMEVVVEAKLERASRAQEITVQRRRDPESRVLSLVHS